MRKFILALSIALAAVTNVNAGIVLNNNDNTGVADNGQNIQYVTAPFSAAQLEAEAKAFGKDVSAVDESPKFDVPVWLWVLLGWIVAAGLALTFMIGAARVNKSYDGPSIVGGDSQLQ